MNYEQNMNEQNKGLVAYFFTKLFFCVKLWIQ